MPHHKMGEGVELPRRGEALWIPHINSSTMTGAVGATDKTNPSVMDRMYDTEPGF
jgi:hypothetical protein